MLATLFGCSSDQYWITETNQVTKYVDSKTDINGLVKFSDSNPCRVPIIHLVNLIHNRSIELQCKKIIFEHILNNGYYVYVLFESKCLSSYYLYYKNTFKCVGYNDNKFTLDGQEYNINIFLISVQMTLSESEIKTKQCIDKFKNEQYNNFGDKFIMNIDLGPYILEGMDTVIESYYSISFPLRLPPTNDRTIKYSINYTADLSHDEIAKLFAEHNSNLEKIRYHYRDEIYMHSYSIKFKESTLHYSVNNLKVKLKLMLSFDIVDETWQDF